MIDWRRLLAVLPLLTAALLPGGCAVDYEALAGGGGAAAGGTGGSSGSSGGTAGEEPTAGSGGSLLPTPPSCDGGLVCGTLDCCLSLPVEAGTFPMGRSESGSDAFNTPSVGTDELPEHDAILGDFYLDALEVTVGRFRKFMRLYSEVVPPRTNQGQHPRVPGSGWQASWDILLPQASALSGLLNCDGARHTWTDSPGFNEDLPINCVDWYVAFAFCVWDGGRLPTEAEYEYAAAGGDENRLYPWGADFPLPTLAVFDTTTAGNVGVVPAGRGRFGHYDLVGNIAEWLLDAYDAGWYGQLGASCEECVNLTNGSERVQRGGHFESTLDEDLRSANRQAFGPSSRDYRVGFRCARDLP